MASMQETSTKWKNEKAIALGKAEMWGERNQVKRRSDIIEIDVGEQVEYMKLREQGLDSWEGQSGHSLEWFSGILCIFLKFSSLLVSSTPESTAE